MCLDQWCIPATGAVSEVPWTLVGLTTLFQEPHQCVKNSLQGSPQSHLCGRKIEVGRGQTPCWCSTGPLFTPTWTMDTLCTVHHQIPTYGMTFVSPFTRQVWYRVLFRFSQWTCEELQNKCKSIALPFVLVVPNSCQYSLQNYYKHWQLFRKRHLMHDLVLEITLGVRYIIRS